jgi:hypothetical protein
VGVSGTTLQITLTTNDEIPEDGIIAVDFPYWNPNEANSNNYEYLITSSSPNCADGDGDEVACSFDTGISGGTLSITDAAAAGAIDAGTELTFTVDSFSNPYSTKSFSGFTIYTTDLEGGSINSDSSVTVTVSDFAEFEILQFSRISSGTINSEADFYFYYQLSDLPIDSGCWLEIRGPAQVDLTTVSDYDSDSGDSPFDLGSAARDFSISADDNSVTIEGCEAYFSGSDNNDRIILEDITTPSSVRDTDTFTFSLYADSSKT